MGVGGGVWRVGFLKFEVEEWEVGAVLWLI